MSSGRMPARAAGEPSTTLTTSTHSRRPSLEARRGGRGLGEPPNPCGLPIATTSWPTRSCSASPSLAGTRSLACARRTARSDSGSAPTTVKSSSRPSTNEARPRPRPPPTTCAEVRRKPSGVMTTALPPPPRRTRRFATEGASRSATDVTAREYASSASVSETSMAIAASVARDRTSGSVSISTGPVRRHAETRRGGDDEVHDVDLRRRRGVERALRGGAEEGRRALHGALARAGGGRRRRAAGCGDRYDRPDPERRDADHRRAVRGDEGAARWVLPHRLRQPRRGDRVRGADSGGRAGRRRGQAAGGAIAAALEHRTIARLFREEWGRAGAGLLRGLGG